MKTIRNVLFTSLISVIFFVKDISCQTNGLWGHLYGNEWKKAKKSLDKAREKDSLWFEWQKVHFDVVDRWDLWRDIIVLYHDKNTDKYWEIKVFVYGIRNANYWKQISKEMFNNPYIFKTYYGRRYPSEHILIVNKKYKCFNYKKAKKILDERRMKQKIIK